MKNNYGLARTTAEITLNRISQFEEVNDSSIEEADKKFNEKTKELWNKFAVSGVLSFDQKTGGRKLNNFTDLDGNSALELFRIAGINTDDLVFIKPGETSEGRINLDTGNKLGASYDMESDTAVFDHHVSESKAKTSTAEIVYETLSGLGMIEKNENLEKAVEFVTKMDNRMYPPEEFLKSGKTIIGLQRHLDFKKILEYFSEHESPNDELNPEELEKYGLKEASLAQQKVIDESMVTLDRMEQEGKFEDTRYGRILINENNELKVGASAAYVRHDGILNITPGKSFALTLRERDFNEVALRENLGEKFQGKIIRGKMWIYNEDAPLMLSKEEIINAIREIK